MPLILDPRLQQIHEARACPDLPSDVCHVAHRKTRLLAASKSLSDLDVFTPLAQLDDGRLVAPVGGKWAIVFNFTEGIGASNLSLQRF